MTVVLCVLLYVASLLLVAKFAPRVHDRYCKSCRQRREDWRRRWQANMRVQLRTELHAAMVHNIEIEKRLRALLAVEES